MAKVPSDMLGIQNGLLVNEYSCSVKLVILIISLVISLVYVDGGFSQTEVAAGWICEKGSYTRIQFFNFKEM